MLTYIPTPRVLISNLYEPERYEINEPGKRSEAQVRYSILIQIEAKVEEDLPAFAREKVEDYSWHGVPQGTRGLRVSSGKVPPRVFGISSSYAAEAAAMNVQLDQIVRDSEAKVAVTMGKGRGRDADKGWPILRAVFVDDPVILLNGYQGFHAYADSMASHWEFQG